MLVRDHPRKEATNRIREGLKASRSRTRCRQGERGSRETDADTIRTVGQTVLAWGLGGERLIAIDPASLACDASAGRFAFERLLCQSRYLTCPHIHYRLQGLDHAEPHPGLRGLRGCVQRRGALAAGLAGAPEGQPSRPLRIHRRAIARAAHRPDGGDVSSVGQRRAVGVRCGCSRDEKQ